MGYKTPRMAKTLVNGVAKDYGETIEQKVERVVNNGEPIEDGAPNVYTERKHGVMAEHDIRTDRWEVATDAMDAVQKSTKAQREKKGITKDDVVKDEVESKDQGKVSNGEQREASHYVKCLVGDVEVYPLLVKTRLRT